MRGATASLWALCTVALPAALTARLARSVQRPVRFPFRPARLDGKQGVVEAAKRRFIAAGAEPGLDAVAVAFAFRLVPQDAVTKRMLADLEVGSVLSGGPDSSIIAGD